MKSPKCTLIYVLLIFPLIWFSCSKETTLALDELPDQIDSVTNAQIQQVSAGDSLEITWVNPDDTFLDQIELIYQLPGEESPKTILLFAAQPGLDMRETIARQSSGSPRVSLTAINKKGVRSPSVIANFQNTSRAQWVARADTLMKALVTLYLDGKPRDIWTSQYPQGGGYWDGAAVIWGHGAAFSGYTALKKATWSLTEERANIEELYDDRLLTAIDQFRNTRDGGPEAYAVYPGEGDERYYDDNIWVGIDMANLYLLTQDERYLDRAKLVWNFVLSGSDDLMGGGVYWKEGLQSKHTCSTFPAAVLALTLYEATQEDQYLAQAEAWYTWGKELLQDPSDKLFWDNVRFSDENDPDSELVVETAKHSYNTGQPMQAAVLLYKATGDEAFLQDAQEMAAAAFARWFVPFRSYLIDESFQILEPGHVWFQAIMMRGFVELYRIDQNPQYIDSYEKTLQHAWLSDARQDSHLLNENFKGTSTQDHWELIHQAAILEMVAQLAELEGEK